MKKKVDKKNTKKRNILFIVIVLSLLAGLTFYKLQNSHNITIDYQEPNKAQDKTTLDLLKKEGVNEVVMDIINNLFIIPEPIYLTYGVDGGPEYYPTTHRIIMPYSFIQEVEQRFVDNKYAETGVSVKTATMDVVIHTVLHELAHALIHIYDLPIVVKEEDAADALATLLLIKFFEDGQEIAITAADIFELESKDTKNFEASDFWDDHSLDVQRYYNTLCIVYGSSPEEYTELITDAKFSDEKAEQCIDDYEQLYFSWAKLLKPHLKNTQSFKF